MKSRGIFPNIHEPEANNCFSIITQVIIEIPKQRNVTFYHKTFSLTFIPGKNKSKCGLSCSVFLSSMGTITIFPNNVFLLLLRVERVCKSF